jgi:hypothetical protein
LQALLEVDWRRQSDFLIREEPTEWPWDKPVQRQAGVRVTIEARIKAASGVAQ